MYSGKSAVKKKEGGHAGAPQAAFMFPANIPDQ
jgi:hypothetical protein